MKPLEPLPSQQPVPPTPVPARSPAAGRSVTSRVVSGRQPARPGFVEAGRLERAPSAPLQATFRFEELARQVVITLMDPQTNEVVRQIPPDEVLKLIASLERTAAAALEKRA